MTILPIVERELRVAARQRFTFWSRLVAAGFALLIFGALQLLMRQAGGGAGAGQVEFSILKWLAFIFALAAGLFLTADSISEEKREGTLGLLFLTDLRGYDVVFGKLLTQSLRAFYGLLAAFPIMGLALLAGGVTGGEFWRAILVICNTLFVSLSLGMLISSLSRDSTKAMNGTLLSGLLVLGGLPFIDLALAGFDHTKFQPMLSLGSPVYLFTNTGGYSFGYYWICLLIQNALAWGFLVLASLQTPRSWQDKSVASSASRPSFFHRWRFGGPRARLALRQRLLGANPLLWLMLRDRWLPRLIWTLTVIVLLMRVPALAVQFHDLQVSAHAAPQVSASGSSTNSLGGVTVYSSASKNSSSTTVVWMGVSPSRTFFLGLTGTLEGLLRIALYLWVASQACRFFVEAARNGALELLLVTPVYPAQIVRSQWLALCRTFLFPTVCVILLQLAGAVIAALEMKYQHQWSLASSTARASAPVISSIPDMSVYLIVQALFSALTTVAALAAVAWFGMWMGLTNRKTSLAVLKTICYVLVLPWIALVFIRIFSTILFIPLGIVQSPTLMLVVPAAIVGLLALGKDAFFIWWAHMSLRAHFRREVTQDRNFRPILSAPMPPVLPPALPPPANAI